MCSHVCFNAGLCRVFTHPPIKKKQKGKKTARAYLLMYRQTWREQILLHAPLIPRGDQRILNEERSETVIGRLNPDCHSTGQLDGCAGLCQICTVLLHFSQITPLSSVIIDTHTHSALLHCVMD